MWLSLRTQKTTRFVTILTISTSGLRMRKRNSQFSGGLIEDLSDAQQEALAENDMETFKRVTEQLMLLLEDYGNDILEMEENDEEEKENE